MAKNIVIQTDGTAVTYSGVKEIETNDPEEGRVTWIPMDETELAIKTVNKNGTYKASSDGYYGYRQFTVSTKNKGKTVGTKPDGRTYAVDTDDDGFLTETLLPDNIRINPQPTKTNYNDGESISLSGAVVKAYSKDDIWEGEGYSGGVIPHGELTLDPSTASGGGGDDDTYTDGDGVNAVLITYSEQVGNRYRSNKILGVYGQYPATLGGEYVESLYVTRYGEYIYAKSVAGSPKLFMFSQEDGEWVLRGTTTYRPVASGFTKGPSWANWLQNIPVSTKDPEQAGSLHPTGGGQSITVKWNRPEDEEELTASFNITVS